VPANHRYRLFRGEIWNPGGSAATPEIEIHRKGALVIDSAGRIEAVGDSAELLRAHPLAEVHDYGESIIAPGFVDTHLHLPQLDIMGSHGEDLLGWLNRYTFPAECAFRDTEIAAETAGRLITELLANGTTLAAIFSSSHEAATDALFRHAETRGIRAVIGKVSMDRNAPAALLSAPDQDLAANSTLIKHWHGREGRLFCALTPRFAPSCSPELLASLGELYQRDPSLYVQTHHAESAKEIAWVKELFPTDQSYAAVYDRFGLLGPRTLLAHSLHPTGDELDLISKRDCAVNHCPTSNMFLGSGLFPWQAFQDKGIRIALGSDIGAGTTLSMWRTMGAAYKVQRLAGHSISPEALFYAATVGGANALRLDSETGRFAKGKQADFQVLDWTRHRLLAHRLPKTDVPTERLFATMIAADDRLTAAVYIGGRKVY